MLLFVSFSVLSIHSTVKNNFSKIHYSMFSVGVQNPNADTLAAFIELYEHINWYLFEIVGFVFAAIWLILIHFCFYEDKPYSRRRVFQLRASYKVHANWLELAWTIYPMYILLVIAVPSFSLIYIVDDFFGTPVFSLKIIGHQWYWSYEYVFGDKTKSFDSYMESEESLKLGELRLLEVDRTIVIPKDLIVRAYVTSDDVIHSWALPSHGLKMDAIPGRLNQFILYFAVKGTFYGQCSELCGVNHGFMPIAVHVVDLKTFVKWFNKLQ